MLVASTVWGLFSPFNSIRVCLADGIFEFWGGPYTERRIVFSGSHNRHWLRAMHNEAVTNL